MKSCPARSDVSRAGSTVSSKPTRPSTSGWPARIRAAAFAATSCFTVRSGYPEARSAPSVEGRAVIHEPLAEPSRHVSGVHRAGREAFEA